MLKLNPPLLSVTVITQTWLRHFWCHWLCHSGIYVTYSLVNKPSLVEVKHTHTHTPGFKNFCIQHNTGWFRYQAVRGLNLSDIHLFLKVPNCRFLFQHYSHLCWRRFHRHVTEMFGWNFSHPRANISYKQINSCAHTHIYAHIYIHTHSLRHTHTHWVTGGPFVTSSTMKNDLPPWHTGVAVIIISR